jgi:hypothetical protein
MARKRRQETAMPDSSASTMRWSACSWSGGAARLGDTALTVRRRQDLAAAAARRRSRCDPYREGAPQSASPTSAVWPAWHPNALRINQETSPDQLDGKSSLDPVTPGRGVQAASWGRYHPDWESHLSRSRRGPRSDRPQHPWPRRIAMAVAGLGRGSTPRSGVSPWAG